MARRAIWKGVISFASVSVPVKLYSAVEDTRVHFHLLHDQDASRLRQQWVCAVEERPVPKDEIVKGAEIGEHEYVLFEPDELAALEPEGGRTIEIVRFVPPPQVDLRYYDRPYHVGPDGSEELLATLAGGLAKTGRIGICLWVMRRKQYLGALSFNGRSVVLTTLRYADEIVPIESLQLPEAKLSAKERQVAGYLVQELTSDWKPQEYHDEHQQRLRELIAAKAAGETPQLPAPEEVAATPEPDLLKTLSASLKAARERGSRRAG